MENKKYGHLVIIEEIKRKNRKYVRCICDCGNESVVRKDQVTRGVTQSCGCLKEKQDKINLNRKTHGKTKTRLYGIWLDMKKRCYNPSVDRYMNYGGRGIYVCEKWRNNFEEFESWAINNGYKDHLTIERKDNDKSYCPENCTWATWKEQANNRTSTNKVIYNGKSMSLKELSEETSISYWIIKRRYRKGDRGESLLRNA